MIPRQFVNADVVDITKPRGPNPDQIAVDASRADLGATFTILTFAARSGDFGTENGLIFSPSELFVANYLGNTLTLVVA
jgi:hypothetical protein